MEFRLPRFEPMPGTVRSSRVTERQLFKRCRRMWAYAHIDKLVPRNIAQDARALGTVVHSCLAEYYTKVQSDPQNKTGAQEAAIHMFCELGPNIDEEQFELGMGMLKGYFDFVAEEDYNWKIHAIEVPLWAFAPDSKYALRGTMDLIVDIPGKGLWIIDHKTYKSFLTPQQIEFDDQLTAYVWLCRQNGIPVKGAIYNMMRKKLPSIPKVLANGSLSKNKAIDSDKETYLKAIHAHGLNPADYKDILSELPDHQFFRRELVMPGCRQLESFGEMLTSELEEMFSETTVHYPHFHRECHYCDFTSLCKSQTDKGDVELMKKALYSTNEQASEIIATNK